MILTTNDGFKFEANTTGIKATGQIFDSETDKRLYLAILENLQLDFKNAPINIADSSYLYQRVKYVIRINKYLDIQADEDLDVKKNVEVLDQNQLRKIAKVHPQFGIFPETTDLQ